MINAKIHVRHCSTGSEHLATSQTISRLELRAGDASEQVLSAVGILQDEADPMVSVMKVRPFSAACA